MRTNFKLKVSPPLKPVAKCKCSTIQLPSMVNSVHRMRRRVITVNVKEGRYYFFVCLHILIYHICLMVNRCVECELFNRKA